MGYSYKEQIKNPLWQKKRLEIMSRDNFTCQMCGSMVNELNVHHLKYISGCKIWEYDNQYLITLCEKCHKIVHEKNITKIKRFDENGYFSLIYNRLALAEFSYLNTSEKIIYSVFARFSLEKSNFSEVDVFISENDTIIPLEEISYRKMASITGLSVGTCINSKKELSNKGFIIGKNIKINRKIVSNGYFKIPPYFKAKGESLNLYVYLKNKSYKYFGHIDTYRRKIAFETGKSVDDIHILLRKLYKLGLAERKGSIIYIR